MPKHDALKISRIIIFNDIRIANINQNNTKMAKALNADENLRNAGGHN